MAVAPDLLQQHLAGEDLARLAGERDQQVELQRRQLHLLAVAADRVGRHVDGDLVAGRTDGQHLRRHVLAPAQPGPHPGHQLLGLERLDHVVVGAGLQPEHHVDGVALGGQHHDRHAGLAPDGAGHVDAAHARQHQVEQDDVGSVVAERGQRPFAVRDEGRHEALAAQHDAEHLGEGGVVIDHEYPGSHGVYRSIPVRLECSASPRHRSAERPRAPQQVGMAAQRGAPGRTGPPDADPPCNHDPPGVAPPATSARPAQEYACPTPARPRCCRAVR